MAIKPTEELTVTDISSMRTAAREAAEQAIKWMPWLKGRVSNRVRNAIRIAYQQGYLTKPINTLSDAELLRVRRIWRKSLAEIRAAMVDI